MLERQPNLGKKTKVILTYFLRKAAFLVSVVALYLVCHLAIWGLSLGLEKFSLDYFAPLLAMVFVLFCSSMIQLAWAPFDHYYQGFIQSRVSRPRLPPVLTAAVYLQCTWPTKKKHLLTVPRLFKVNFLNKHLGIAFPVPIAVMNQKGSPTGAEVGLITANFCEYINPQGRPPCFLVLLFSPTSFPTSFTPYTRVLPQPLIISLCTFSLVFILSFIFISLYLSFLSLSFPLFVFSFFLTLYISGSDNSNNQSPPVECSGH